MSAGCQRQLTTLVESCDNGGSGGACGISIVATDEALGKGLLYLMGAHGNVDVGGSYRGISFHN